jgi:7-cyano-7-deazaguanine synthase in queuosine biosynthesis
MAPKQKKGPEDFPVIHELTKEEKDIIAQTKVLEKRETLPQKTGVVLTGGIDSTVTLCKVKRTGSMEIQPIVFEGDQEIINKILEKEGITNSIKQFDNTNTKAGKKEVLQWCFENNINPLYFGSCYEEYLINSLVEEFNEWQQISSEMNNYGVHVEAPMGRVEKHEMIKEAKDFGILELTAKPNDSKKFKDIRDKAFATAKISDPHAEVELEP